MEMIVEGIITNKNRSMYTLCGSEETYVVYSEKELEIGIQGKFNLIKDYKGYKYVSHQEGDIYDKLYKKIYSLTLPKQNDWLLEDDTTQCLKEQGTKLIRHLITSQKLGRKILLRYHNDADGISGGLAFKKLLGSILNYQNSGAVYSPNFALSDLSLLSNAFKPIVILIDFGSSKESNEGLSLLNAAGIETVIIDHHPYDEKPGVGWYISPWECEGNSQYPAGYISCELVQPFMDYKKIKDLMKISLAGDKSKLVKTNDEDKRKAIIFDYIATYSHFPNTLAFYETVLEDESILNSIGLAAEEKLDSIKIAAKHYTKEKIFGDLKVVILQLDKIVQKHSFPSKSKAAGAVFEMYEDPIILVGKGKKLITLRVSDNAKKIVSGREIVEEMKKQCPQGVLSGGGHDAAASMRCDPELTEIVVENLLEFIQKKLHR
ncbi:hypothetical protein KO465_02500 [Candidatus Micrarchaeota archaeon]|nr:hypothetical protein [Candidatus Micrarchaeota archaeon]